jgi:hypothetical protein
MAFAGLDASRGEKGMLENFFERYKHEAQASE